MRPLARSQYEATLSQVESLAAGSSPAASIKIRPPKSGGVACVQLVDEGELGVPSSIQGHHRRARQEFSRARRAGVLFDYDETGEAVMMPHLGRSGPPHTFRRRSWKLDSR